MTSWLSSGRSALHAAIDEACSKIEHDLSSDLEKRRLQAEEESEKLEQSHAAAIKALEKENTRLRHELDQVRCQPRVGKDWETEYNKGKARFLALSDNFKKAREALEKRRSERDKWVEHATVLEKRIKAAEEEHNIRILDRGSKKPHELTLPGVGRDSSHPSLALSFASEGLPTTDDYTEAGLAKSTGIDLVNNKAALGCDPPSESTEEDINEEQTVGLPVLQAGSGRVLAIKAEPSSDGLVVLYERPVKRRRYKGESEATPTTKRIKTEESELASSPSTSVHHYDFNPHESIDLGAGAPPLATPRKRKDLDAVEESPEQHAAVLSAAVHLVPVSLTNPDASGYRNLQESSAFAPINVNLQISKPEVSTPTGKELAKGLSHGIEDLAEDGGLYSTKSAKGRNVTPANGGRLKTLLNSASDETPSSILRTARRVRDTPGYSGDELPIPKPRELPFERSARQSAKKVDAQINVHPRTPLADKTNNARNVRDQSSTKRKAPGSLLRNKPVSDLRPEDFKVNPRANQGHDFAFSDVVRSRDERACLPGCVDEHCCGKEWRALAITHRHNPPLTAAQRQEEQKLLEDYLGDYCYRLATITKEERDELWIEAKTQELANKYGKHRHQFSRMRSPPGFWNADFPSTQELEADRAEAAKREKQSVRERHREAMRSGGRWMFRDE